MGHVFKYVNNQVRVKQCGAESVLMSLQWLKQYISEGSAKARVTRELHLGSHETFVSGDKKQNKIK